MLKSKCQFFRSVSRVGNKWLTFYSRDACLVLVCISLFQHSSLFCLMFIFSPVVFHCDKVGWMVSSAVWPLRKPMFCGTLWLMKGSTGEQQKYKQLHTKIGISYSYMVLISSGFYFALHFFRLLGYWHFIMNISKLWIIEKMFILIQFVVVYSQ